MKMKTKLAGTALAVGIVLCYVLYKRWKTEREIRLFDAQMKQMKREKMC